VSPMFVPTRRPSNPGVFSNARIQHRDREPSHRLLLTVAILGVLAAGAIRPALAQTSGGKRAEANLRIRVHIVRVVKSRADRDDKHEKDGDIFSLPDAELKMSGIEEERMLAPAESSALQSGQKRSAILRTRTFVLP
jgi:hypothetical protein